MWTLRTIPGLSGAFDRLIQAIVVKGTADISLSPLGDRVGSRLHTLLLQRFIVVYMKRWHTAPLISEFRETWRIEGSIKPVGWFVYKVRFKNRYNQLEGAVIQFKTVPAQ
jgi:hypothetical protein